MTDGRAQGTAAVVFTHDPLRTKEAVDLLAMASAFDVVPYGAARHPLRKQLVRVERRGYPPGPEAWAIRDEGGHCLTRDHDWEWEPRPSERHDDWLARARWSSAEEAVAFAQDHLRLYPTGFRNEE